MRFHGNQLVNIKIMFYFFKVTTLHGLSLKMYLLFIGIKFKLPKDNVCEEERCTYDL